MKTQIKTEGVHVNEEQLVAMGRYTIERIAAALEGAVSTISVGLRDNGASHISIRGETLTLRPMWQPGEDAHKAIRDAITACVVRRDPVSDVEYYGRETPQWRIDAVRMGLARIANAERIDVCKSAL